MIQEKCSVAPYQLHPFYDLIMIVVQQDLLWYELPTLFNCASVRQFTEVNGSEWRSYSGYSWRIDPLEHIFMRISFSETGEQCCHNLMITATNVLQLCDLSEDLLLTKVTVFRLWAFVFQTPTILIQPVGTHEVLKMYL